MNSISRELAIGIARDTALAFNAAKPGVYNYLPTNEVEAANWMPHAWVVEAIQKAGVTPADPPTTWQQRVIVEQAELQTKVGALSDFMGTDAFGELNEADRKLLTEQYEAMCAYLGGLDERIAKFG